MTKIFISYSNKDRALAQRLKDDLARMGCDPWQFDLSALPGSDAWDSILGRIENSQAFIVLLSNDTMSSRAVLEEISHAHYCSINNSNGQPKIVPLILESNVLVPRQIIRLVRLPFNRQRYDSDFDLLLRSIGVENSPFAASQSLDVTFSRETEFDVEREAGIFASSLIRNNDQVAEIFTSLRADVREPINVSPQTVVWEETLWRERPPSQLVINKTFKIAVFFVALVKHTKGFESAKPVVIEIAAFEELKYEDLGGYRDLILKSDNLRLKFEGFREISATPITMS